MYRKKILSILCATVFSVVNTVQPCESAQITQGEYNLFMESRRYLEGNRYDLALKSLSTYFQQHSSRHEYAYELYSSVLLNQKLYDEAIKILKDGRKEYPKNANLAQNLGLAYYCNKELALAAKSYEDTYALRKEKDITLLVSAAYFYLTSKKYKDTIRILTPILKHKDVKADWYQMLAQAYLENKQVKDATVTLEKGVGHFKDNARLWRSLGFIYYDRKIIKKAVACYEIAYSLETPSVSDLEQLARMYCAIDAPVSGKRLLEKLESRKKVPADLLDALAYTYVRLGDFTTATYIARKALERQKNDERVFRLAQIVQKNGDYKEATILYRKVIDGNGEYKERASWSLALMLWKIGDFIGLENQLLHVMKNSKDYRASAEQLYNTVKLINNKTLSFQ